MNGFLNDLRFGLRQLAAKPGFATAAILTLALGIGANTAVFSVLSGYLLKPLPYPHSDRLVQINEDQAKAGIRYASISVPNYLGMVGNASDFSALGAFGWDSLNLTHNGAAQAISAIDATASLFNVLKVQPLLGRTFTGANQQPGRGQVVVLSYRFWQQKLGGDPDVVGTMLQLNGKPYKVLGVMPRQFVFLDRTNELFVPFVWTAKEKSEAARGSNNLKVLARLKPGISIAAATTQLEGVLQQVARISAGERQSVKELGVSWWLAPWQSQLIGGREPLLLLLQGAVLLVLAMTCVNVANLLLARILGRTHEMAMRSALGASRAALSRQLLSEGMCLAVPGGAGGIGLAWWALQFIRRLGLGTPDDVFSIAPDWRVALFALGAVITVAIAITLLPIRHLARTDLQSVLQEGGRTTSGGPSVRRVRNGLVVAELALATALLAGSGLLIHSFIKLHAADPGFDPDHLLTASVVIPADDHPGTKATAQFYAQLAQHVEKLPGVRDAAFVMQLPFSSGSNGGYGIVGRSLSPTPWAEFNFVGGDYFKTLGLPILKGRAFDARDKADGEPVVIIDQLLAKKYFPDGNAIGQHLKLGDKYKPRIVGVVPTIDNESPAYPVTMETIYFPIAQQMWMRDLNLVVRTALPPPSLIEPLKKLVGQVDPLVSISDFETMQQVMADKLQDRHATLLMVLAFGAIALALAIVGVYAVMSYAVAQRRAECGVRLALGALPEDLRWLVLHDGLRLLAIGVIVGLGLAVLFGYLMSARLYRVAPFDPVTLAGSAVVLCVITLAACWLPARRAAKLDPAVAMMEQ